jgi:hypothetical protein
MKLTKTLLIAFALLMAVPAVASAQLDVTPPKGDNYLDAVPLNGATALRPSPSVVGFTADTTNYTVEGPGGIFGASGEFNQCGSSAYGKTIWSYFTVNRTGRIDVTAAGFDAVIGLASFKSPNNPAPQGGPCVDRLSGRIESFPRDNLPTVQKGHWYAVQVGGFQNQQGQVAGGPLEVDVELLPPEQIVADASITYLFGKGGIKITSVRVSGPPNSVAAIGCVRKKCGKDVTVRNPKVEPKGVFAQTLFRASPQSTGLKQQPAKVSRKPVRMATTNAFKGRFVPNGGRLAVVVISRNNDKIGQIFYWDVRKNQAGPKNVGCVEPGSTRSKRLGTCNGT